MNECREQIINRGWEFWPGMYHSSFRTAPDKTVQKVNLPHDYMIESQVKVDAPAGPAMGYYDGTVGSYVKMLEIPAEWSGERVLLHFDGIMMNSTIEINGNKIASHHYGYTPFWVDITPYMVFGESNRLTVVINPSMQPNSRWYTGAGIYRDVTLVHVPKLHVAPDGVFVWTKRIDWNGGNAETAFLQAEVTVENHCEKNHIALVQVTAVPVCGNGEWEAEIPAAPKGWLEKTVIRSAKIQIEAGKQATARIPVTVSNPRLWCEETPDRYRLEVQVTDLGEFANRLIESAGEPMEDQTQVMFGIRTVTADSSNGLLETAGV